MCLSYPARGLGKKWSKLAVLAVTTVGFASPLFPQIGPTVRLSTPVIQGLTATVNGVTRPRSAATRITGIVWNWGDGTAPVLGWFPQSHTYAVSGIYKVTVTSAQSDGQTGFATTTVNLSMGLRQARATAVPGAPGRFVHVSGTEVTSEAECTSRDHPIEIREEHGTGTVRILSGSGTFASISSRNKIITVGPGEALAGTVGLRVLNTGPGFAIAPLIETPSWGRHQDSWKMITNIRPGESTLDVPINERAPAEAGTYYIVFAFALETNGASVAAATNWAVGQPVWDDGNDLAELDGPQILEAQQFGCAVINGLGEQGYHLLYEPADVIVVKVGGPSAAGELKAAPSHAKLTPLANGSYKLPIQIVNEQASDAPAPFVQQLVIDSSEYAQFEAENLQNIRFFDDTGHVIPSWLESGNSRSSTRTVYWLRLPRGIRARGVVRLFMTFAPPTQNMFDGAMTGEAPGLSPEYGHYDNGARVFARYANFIGGSLPEGWSSNVTPGSRGAVEINNGVRIWHSGTGGGASFLGSDWLVQTNVVEMHLLSEMTNNGQDMVMYCTARPAEDAWTPASVGYQNGSGLEVENNQSGTPSVLARARLNPLLPAVIGFQGNTVFANYEPAITTPGPICGGGYLAAWANTGFNASFSFDWVRMRPAEPGNVMPKAAASQETSSAGQNSQGQATWAEELSAWRAERASELDAPDGLLSQVAIDFLKPGNNSVGSAATNQVLLPQGPPELGIFHVQFEHGTVSVDNPPDYITLVSVGLEPPPGGFPAGLLVDGKPPRPGQGLCVYGMPTRDPPSTLTFGSLLISLEMYVGNRLALNVKDADAPARVSFHGLRWYPPNPAYRVRAKWIPYKPPKTITITTLTGPAKQTSPGAAEFSLDGKQFLIEPTLCPFIPLTYMHLHPGMVRHLQQTLGQLRFAISDPTNRDKTYPGGRWLYTSFPEKGLDQPDDLWLDFNRLENPPWAYTNVAEWGPPPQRLPVAIPAGEQRYHD